MSGNTEGRGNRTACVSFAKLLWLNLSLLWILLKTQKLIGGKKGIQQRGSCALLGTEKAHTVPHSRDGAALSLLFLRVFQRVCGRLWRGGAHNSAQSPCPLPSILWVKKGSAGFWRGKSRALHTINPLARSLPHLGTDHRGTQGFTLSVTHTDWHKKELLGLFRAGV